MNGPLVMILAVILDLAAGDPPNRLHPVALMGRWLAWGRRHAPTRARFLFGAFWVSVGMAIFAGPWTAARWDSGAQETGFFAKTRFLLIRFTVAVAALKSAIAYRGLRAAVSAVGHALAAGDLDQARHLLGYHLVSRDTSRLTSEEVAGAAMESLAENLTDGFSAPLFAYALGDMPAAWGYRFVNTADAMWGYRTTEFEQLGKFPARLDDALNWLPARLTAGLLAISAGLVGLDGGNAARVMWAQHGRTASPNAGWTIGAMAGALGVTLSKRDGYDLVGGDNALDAAAIERAVQIADVAAGLCLAVAVGLSCGRDARNRVFTSPFRRS